MTPRTISGEVKPGTELPKVSFGPISRATLALYAAASGDYDPVHLDIDFAQEAGLPDVIAHGMLTLGLLSRVVTEWCDVAQLRALSGRFVSITNVHDRVTCRGRVIACLEENGERRALVQLCATAHDGRETVTGEALVALG